MDELDRLYRRLVQNIRAGFPELLTRGFEVSQLYQHIIPYRTNRRELGFDSNEEYELAVMQLLAGLRGYLLGDAEMQKAMRTELASPNPDLAAFRIFATSTVSLSAEALRALEKRAAGGELVASASSLSPSEQAVLAGRQTDLGGGGEHAFGFHAAHLGFANGEAAGKLRAGEAAGDFVADLVVLRTADDLAELALAGIDLGDLELVRVRVLHGFLDLRDDDFIRGDAFGNNAFHLDTGEGEKVVDFLDRLA